MDWVVFAEQYGPWVGLLVYILLKDAVPFATSKWLPAKIKEAEEQRAEARQDAVWRKKMEEERLAELREIAGSTRALQLNMAATNERMGALMAGQQVITTKIDFTQSFLSNAIADMRESVALRRGREDAEDDAKRKARPE